jgi:hypothetical protein
VVILVEGFLFEIGLFFPCASLDILAIVTLQVFDVKEKLECYTDAKRCLIAMNDENYGEQLSDSIRLLKYSVKLEDELNQSLSHLSLRDLFIWLIEHGHHTSAETLRKDFRITDKQ